MKQWDTKEFVKMLNENGYSFVRCKGSHSVYRNNAGNHISIPRHIRCVIAKRLIKENNLTYDSI